MLNNRKILGLSVTSSVIIFFSDQIIKRNSNWLSDVKTLMENPHIHYPTSQSGKLVKDIAFDLVSLRIGFEVKARSENACTDNIGEGDVRCQAISNQMCQVSNFTSLLIIVINCYIVRMTVLNVS